MSEAHGTSRRKKSGGRYRPSHKKKKRNLAGDFAATTIGETKVKNKDSRGATEKQSMRRTDTVNVATTDGEVVEAEIEAVLENPANPDFVRRNVITKGTILETAEGKARVTSRPGQDGTLNAEQIQD